MIKIESKPLIFIRSIIAVIMALTLVRPACCCSANVEHSQKASSCCHGKTAPGDKEDGPKKICACKAHDPKDKAEVLLIPGGTVRDIAPPVYEFSLAPSTYFTPVITAIIPYIIDDPLEDILVRHSRWLI